MKTWVLVCCCIVLNNHCPGAQEYAFGWSVGSVGLSGDVRAGKLIGHVDMLNGMFIIQKDAWRGAGLVIGSALFSTTLYKNDDSIRYSFLPLELGFVPAHKDGFYMSFYGRGEWLLSQPGDLFFTKFLNPASNKFHGAAGIRLFIFGSGGKAHYSLYSSLFMEYTTSHELRIGITLDPVILVSAAAIVGIPILLLGGIIMGGTMGGTAEEDFDKDRQRVTSPKLPKHPPHTPPGNPPPG
jgi:hypothetical protein